MVADTKPPPSSSAVLFDDVSKPPIAMDATELQMQQSSSPIPAQIIITNLSILSPRQKTSNSPKNNNEIRIALPPLRAEESVAAIRGALNEVLGLAHLTKYRLVVETCKQARSNSSNSSSTKQAGNNNSNKNAVWSPYTLRNAKVSISPSLSSLVETSRVPHYLTNSANEEEKGGGDAEKEGEKKELVLDDYGDLSMLVPLLEKEVAANNDDGANDNNSDNDADPKEKSESNETIAHQQRIQLDASSYALRIILEKYDLSSIKDHILKIRNLFEGNAPFLSSLDGNEEAANEGENENVSEGSMKGDKEENEGKVIEGDKRVKQAVVDDGKKQLTKEEEEAAEKARQEAIAAALPSITPEYDILYESAARNGDLTNFYYLACGEEQTLLDLQKNGTSDILNGESSSNKNGRKFSFEESNDQHQQKEKENKKKNSNRKKKNGKNKNGNNIGTSSSSSENEEAAATSTTIAKAAELNNTKQPSYQQFVEKEQSLYNLNETTHISASVRLSGFHPPPSHRRVFGDLAYIEAIMPDGQAIHITAIPMGFYINRSTSTKFDPTPAISSSNKDACYSHALLDTLLQKSKSLRMSWSPALSASKKRSDLLRDLAATDTTLYNFFRPAASSYPNNSSTSSSAIMAAGAMMGILLASPSTPTTFTSRIDSLTVRPSWLVPLPSVKQGDVAGPKLQTYNHSALHSWNTNRVEDELTYVYGMDVRGGGIRDWNEELQTARELPVETFNERIDRARLVHKVLSDFGEAALHGVKAIFDGYIQPMNPSEPARAHVYLHNNIFFSRAVDTGLDTFKVIQGDAAAKKSASRDCHNMGVLHRLDIPGLHTLATVLVEYLGTRIVCQSVVPGILHGDKSHSLLYGAVETLSALECDGEMHTLLESSIGEGCMVATRSIPKHPLSDDRMALIRENRLAPPPDEGKKDDINNEDDVKKAVEVCGPMEMKGILGSDKRKYVLDCTRLTPRDANWVSKDVGGTGRWEDSLESGGVKSQLLVPPTLDDDEWTVCVLRPELLTSYAEMKIREYLAKFNKEKRNGKEGGEEDKKEEKDDPVAADGSEKQPSDKEWVNIGPAKETKENASEEKKKEEVNPGTLPMAKVEEEYIRSLRYNVNVFLPFTRSIEIIDEDSHEKLKQDEEEAREIARYLFDMVIPGFTKEIRASSGNGLNLVADGKALTEMMHARGINCRYLGRLAKLARKEELEDLITHEKATAAAALAIAAASSPEAAAKVSCAKQYTCPRFRMPSCWLELLECEIVARAAKHVLDSYISEQGNTPTAETIASFLSAVMSVGEESAGETELRMSKQTVNGNDDKEELTLEFFDNDPASASSSSSRGREEIWHDIEKEVGRRFRYTLSLYNTTSSSSSSKNGGENRALYIPLLRRICQRSGFRLVAKQYKVGKKCVCGGSSTGSYPIAASDIVDVLPLVKHAASVSGQSFAPCAFSGGSPIGSSSTLHVLLSDANDLYGVAHANLSSRNFAFTLELANECAALCQRVMDSPLHPTISKCLRLAAIAHSQLEEPEHALTAASKYLAIAIALHGFDSAEVLQAHLTLSDIFLGVGQVVEGVKHVRTGLFLMEMLGGKNYAAISPNYYRIASYYYEAGKIEEALQFYIAAAARRNEDRMFDCLIARNSAGVLARLGRFKEAFEYEKKAYQLYLTFVGEDHDATKACSNTLVQLMRLSLEQEKQSKIEAKERIEKNAADAVADQIRADEEAKEAKPKKKKNNKSKKKGKK